MPRRAPFPGYYSLLKAFILILGVVVAWFVYSGIYNNLIGRGADASQAAFIALLGFGITLAFWIGTLTVALRIGAK